MYGYINNKKLLLFFLVNIISICLFIFTTSVYAHIPQEDNNDDDTIATVQEWIDQENNVKIQFSYSPEKPIVYALTDLKFSIQELETGNHLKDLVTSLTIIKGQKIFFKFNDVIIQNGDLSLKVRFLEDGNYQLISKVSSKDNIAIAVASFNILVPLQPFGSFNMDSLTPLLFPLGLVAISGAAAVIGALIILSRKEKEEEKLEEREEKKEEDSKSNNESE